MKDVNVAKLIDAAEELHMCAKRIRSSLAYDVKPKAERLARFEAAIQEYAKASCKQADPLGVSMRQPVESLGCPDVERMGQFACSNRSSCWEPCGMLGHDARNAVRVTA